MFGHGDRFPVVYLVVACSVGGRYTWSDGGFYEGQYQDKGRQKASKSSGLRSGFGTRWWVSGNMYGRGLGRRSYGRYW